MPLHVPASTGQRRWTGTVEPEPGLALPCTIIRGRLPGPKLLVTAGVHGAEYSSIEAARRLTALSPDSITRTSTGSSPATPRARRASGSLPGWSKPR